VRYSPRGDNGNIGPRGRRQRDGGRRSIRSELSDRRYDLEQNRSVEINEFNIGVLYTFLRYFNDIFIEFLIPFSLIYQPREVRMSKQAKL